MKLRSYLAAALACTAAALSGCNQANGPGASSSPEANALGSSVVSASDGTQIPESLYRYYAQSAVRKAPEDLTDQERSAVLDSLATLKLLSDAAKDQGLPNERMIAVQLELQEEQLLARAVVSRYLEQNPPTESEIQAAYQEDLPSLGATQFKARHILLVSTP